MGLRISYAAAMSAPKVSCLAQVLSLAVASCQRGPPVREVPEWHKTGSPVAEIFD
jgi:hypothetical protein